VKKKTTSNHACYNRRLHPTKEEWNQKMSQKTKDIWKDQRREDDTASTLASSRSTLQKVPERECLPYKNMFVQKGKNGTPNTELESQ